MWRLYLYVEILNIVLLFLLAYRIHQLEKEKYEMISEFIKELNKLRNKEK